jgi:hypothetical protein
MPPAARVEQVVPNYRVDYVQVLAQGAGWDLYEVTPRQVDLVIPDSLDDVYGPRSASYLHGEVVTATLTLDANASAGDTELVFTELVASEVSGPEPYALSSGETLEVTTSEVEELVFYDTDFADISNATAEEVARAINRRAVLFRAKVIVDPATDLHHVRLDAVEGEPSLEVSNATATALAFPAAVTNVAAGIPPFGVLEAQSTSELIPYYIDPSDTDVYRVHVARGELQSGYSATDLFDFYNPATAGVADGAWAVGQWLGPYGYQEGQRAPTLDTGPTELATTLAGPQTLVVDVQPGSTALEVEDAAYFDLQNFPYSARLGARTSGQETVSVLDVNLHMRARTTVGANIGTVGATNEVEVADLSLGGAGDGADFPNVSGYRVILDRGGPNEEVVFVTSTATAPSRLILQGLNARVHSIGETVELMADVVSVAPVGSFHQGIVPYSYRSTEESVAATTPPLRDADFSTAETLSPLVSSVTVADGAGFPLTGGHALLQFGTPLVPVQAPILGGATAGDTLISTMAASGVFPSTFPFKVTISPGTPYAEVALVTDTPAANVLEINDATAGYGLK